MYVYSSHDFVSHALADPSQGSWEQEELDNIKYALSRLPLNGSQQQPLFVDVGANIGWFTLNAASLGARVYAFEGEPLACNAMVPSFCLIYCQTEQYWKVLLAFW
jgi:hypothetical protein